MEKLEKFQRLVKSSRAVGVLCHQNADPDSLCSGFGLSHLLRKIRRRLKVMLITPGGVSKVSQVVARELRIEFSTESSLTDFDLLATVDVNTIQQLGDFAESLKTSAAPLIVVDHHSPDPRTKKLAKILVCDERSSSTAEVVHMMSKKLKIAWPKREAQALLAGMVYDSNHFALAGPATFRSAVDLIDRGADPRRAVAILRQPMDDSERMARIKAGQRTQLMRIGGWIIALSHVNSHQATAARGLVALGAHVAIVAGERKGQIRVSLRSVEAFNRETGIHLGRDVARPLGERMGGMGGGHESASGAVGQGSVEEAIEYCGSLLREKLEAARRSA